MALSLVSSRARVFSARVPASVGHGCRQAACITLRVCALLLWPGERGQPHSCRAAAEPGAGAEPTGLRGAGGPGHCSRSSRRQHERWVRGGIVACWSRSRGGAGHSLVCPVCVTSRTCRLCLPMARRLPICPCRFHAAASAPLPATGALEDFSAAIELQPGGAEAWKRRGQTRQRAGDGGGALADLQRAIDLLAPRGQVGQGAA